MHAPTMRLPSSSALYLHNSMFARRQHTFSASCLRTATSVDLQYDFIRSITCFPQQISTAAANLLPYIEHVSFVHVKDLL